MSFMDYYDGRERERAEQDTHDKHGDEDQAYEPNDPGLLEMSSREYREQMGDPIEEDDEVQGEE